MMRPGDNAKLAPEAEQAHLAQLRVEREAKAHIKLQAEAQALALTLSALELNEVPVKAKELAADKKFGGAAVPAAVAIALNTVVRNGVPPKEEESTPRGKKGGGGNKKQTAGVKAGKVEDRPPCTTAEARKAIKTHKHTLRECGSSPAAETALLRAVESWLLSPHGAVALPGAAKVIEVLYDLDLASEEVLTRYWAEVQTNLTRQQAELERLKGTCAELEATGQAAAEAVKKAEAEQSDLAYYKKNSEQYAQNVRCGNNPNKEEEALEKSAIAKLKKAIDLHTQSQKVLAARHKTLVADKAALETEQRSLAELQKKVEHLTPFVTHATPFFEWLAASDEESEED